MGGFANVVLRVPIHQEFTYLIPGEIKNVISIGSIVLVPFGKRKLGGVVVGFPESSPVQKLKEIISVIENKHVVLPDLLQLGKWMRDYYYSPIGEILNSFYPSALTDSTIKEKKETIISLSKNNIQSKFTANQKSVIECLQKKNKLNFAELISEAKVSRSVILTMLKNNFLSSEERIVESSQFSNLNDFSQPLPVMLTEQQQNVFNSIKSSLKENIYKTFLLHGITGSGKTEIYIETLRESLAEGKRGIVLVPEISLTPQTVKRFRKHFPTEVVVLHSRISARERFESWKMISDGKYSIVIGPRSVLFAPLKNIGVIVVDEEHESTYKQFDSTPRYHVRDVAIMRAKLNNAIVILGSSTPSLESYNNALNGKFNLLELHNRIDNATLPIVHLVDLKDEYQKFKDHIKLSGIKTFQHSPSLSTLLKDKINDRLQKKEGIILLQNRRGFAPLLICEECGFTHQCKECDVSLTYHKKQNHLRCHYCGRVEKISDVCPKCNGSKLHLQGFGTQRVEEELIKEFPTAKIIRMDLDTTSERNGHNILFEKFGNREVDILLGTQMVAKGLDFAHVTLVGIISADTQLTIPDFRSGERTFQLLTQVAGRAGRGSIKGEVVLQTFSPTNYAIQFALHHDFVGFYNKEIESRQELSYPPFSKLILFELKGKSNDSTQNAATKIYNVLLNNNEAYDVLGPSPAMIARVNNYFRWHVLLKVKKPISESTVKLQSLILPIISRHEKEFPTIKLIVDVDPIGVL